MVLRVVQRYHSDSVPQLTTPRANGQGWNVCYTQQNVLHPQPFKLNSPKDLWVVLGRGRTLLAGGRGCGPSG